ncbi:TPA: erythromycin resistance leader peptide [Streptococcus agalactiae]|nr:ErmCL family antibiotic resistance leader peptide [Streptococcus agalactiae]
MFSIFVIERFHYQLNQK